MKISFIGLIQILCLFLFFITYSDGEVKQAMILTSANFNNQGAISAKHTCDGNNISPSLSWTNAPAGTKSFALIVDDPDAPSGTWVHWVLYDIPPDVNELAEGIKSLPAGTMQGLNDWNKTGYRGPCPPSGRHRYFFKIYALDIVFADMKNPTKSKLEKAMEGHVLSKAELVGTYKR
jgi:Raf kinase inhibitor-like YbhB/YbcL family protein